MEEEAARITKETEELEQKKNDKTTGGDASKAANGDAPSQDGYDFLYFCNFLFFCVGS
jgi:hypothetical protein